MAARQCQYTEAKKSFEAAFRVAERCGDHEGAGLALLIMFEEVNDEPGLRYERESHKTYEQQ